MIFLLVAELRHLAPRAAEKVLLQRIRRAPSSELMNAIDEIDGFSTRQAWSFPEYLNPADLRTACVAELDARDSTADSISVEETRQRKRRMRQVFSEL